MEQIDSILPSYVRLASNENDLLAEFHDIQRRKFATRIYSLSFLFILFATVPWIVINQWFNSYAVNFLQQHDYFSYSCVLSALLGVIVFASFTEVRNSFPYNWMLLIYIIVFSTFGSYHYIINAKFHDFLIAFGSVLALMALTVLIGLYFFDLTEKILLIFIFTMVMGVIAITTASVLTHNKNVAFGICMILIFTVYFLVDVQMIHGCCSLKYHLDEHVLIALHIYIKYVILFVAILSTEIMKIRVLLQEYQ